MISRRGLLLGLTSLIVAPAIVRYANIMPVRALVLPPEDPLTWGAHWQSWPFGTERPELHSMGSISPVGHTPKPYSYWVSKLEKHRELYERLYIEPLPDWRVRPTHGQPVGDSK